MSGSEKSDDTEYCPWCEEMTYQVVIQYEPDPNGAQRDADDIPTDSLQIVAGQLCTECGDLIDAIPAEARRSIRDTNR